MRIFRINWKKKKCICFFLLIDLYFMFLKFNYIACSPLLHIFFTYISNYQTKDIYRRRTYFFSSYFPFLNIFQVNHKSFISIYIFSLVLNMAIKNIFIIFWIYIQTTLFDTCNNIARVITPFLHFDK